MQFQPQHPSQVTSFQVLRQRFNLSDFRPTLDKIHPEIDNKPEIGHIVQKDLEGNLKIPEAYKSIRYNVRYCDQPRKNLWKQSFLFKKNGYIGKRSPNTNTSKSIDRICDDLTKKLKAAKKLEKTMIHIAEEPENKIMDKVLPDDIYTSNSPDRSFFREVQKKTINQIHGAKEKDPLDTSNYVPSEGWTMQKRVSFNFNPDESVIGSTGEVSNRTPRFASNEKEEFYSQESKTPMKATNEDNNNDLSPFSPLQSNYISSGTDDFFKDLEAGKVPTNSNNVLFSSDENQNFVDQNLTSIKFELTPQNSKKIESMDTEKTASITIFPEKPQKAKDYIGQEANLTLQDLQEIDKNQAVWNLDIRLKHPMNRNFNVRIHKKRRLIDLKGIIRYRLENMELEKISNLKNMHFEIEGKRQAIEKKFIELWNGEEVPLQKVIDVHFEIKSTATKEKSRVVTTTKIPRLVKYKCIPNPVEFFRM